MAEALLIGLLMGISGLFAAAIILRDGLLFGLALVFFGTLAWIVEKE